MNVAIIGTGRVGSVLSFLLARNPRFQRVTVISRLLERADATVKDAVSAEPKLARKMWSSTLDRLGEPDLIVAACGAAIAQGRSMQDLAADNIRINQSVLTAIRWRPEMTLVIMAAPVDEITPLAVKWTGLAAERVIGFGGDLDRNRLLHILSEAGRFDSPADVVGEHGERAIPIYPDDHDYSEIATKLRQFLRRIAAAGPLRNLAPAIVLAELCDTIASARSQVHRVCCIHPTYGCHLTWPFLVSRGGIGMPIPLQIHGQAQRDLADLVAARGKSTLFQA